jgi:hypothetical protein
MDTNGTTPISVVSTEPARPPPDTPGEGLEGLMRTGPDLAEAGYDGPGPHWFD